MDEAGIQGKVERKQAGPRICNLGAWLRGGVDKEMEGLERQ